MKAARGAVGKAVDQPDPNVRFYLFHGPDEGQSRSLGERLLKGLQAEKFVVAAAAVKADPAALPDEASAIGLFGGRRAIWIEPAGDEIAAGAEALLELAACESPVVAIAGALRKTSVLLKLAEANPAALAYASYELNERDSAALVEEMARSEGLRPRPGIAARIAAAAGNDRGVIAQELAKLALYLGAAPDSPADLDLDALEAVGAGNEGDRTRLGDLALAGRVEELAREMDSSACDAEPVLVIRALQRRIVMLAPIRSRVDHGERPHDAVASAGKSVFWKDKDLVARLVALWDSRGLERIAERSGELERKLMRGDSPPPAEALEEMLVAIARTAQRQFR